MTIIVVVRRRIIRIMIMRIIIMRRRITIILIIIIFIIIINHNNNDHSDVMCQKLKKKRSKIPKVLWAHPRARLRYHWWILIVANYQSLRSIIVNHCYYYQPTLYLRHYNCPFEKKKVRERERERERERKEVFLNLELIFIRLKKTASSCFYVFQKK